MTIIIMIYNLEKNIQQFNDLRCVKVITVIVNTLLLVGTISSIITGFGLANYLKVWNSNNLSVSLILIMPMYISNLALKELFKR